MENNNNNLFNTEIVLKGKTTSPETIDTLVEEHPFAPFIPANIRVLIIGSFPGKGMNTENHWFYSAPRNQFWKIMKEVYPSVSLESVADKKNFFEKAGIGITDILLKVQRGKGGNNDKDLVIKEYNDVVICSILRNNAHVKVYFTSHFVEKVFISLFPDFKSCEYLPSPSPIFRIMSLKEKAKVYKEKLPAL